MSAVKLLLTALSAVFVMLIVSIADSGQETVVAVVSVIGLVIANHAVGWLDNER